MSLEFHIKDQIKCPICYTSEYISTTKFGSGTNISLSQEYNILFCNNCLNGFTYPHPSEEDYKLSIDVPGDNMSFIEKFILRKFTKMRVSRIRKLIDKEISTPLLLDVGGGACSFANESAKFGFRAFVLEPNKDNKIYADEKNGVNFISELFNEDLLKNGILRESQFDIITMWHALEHFSNPQSSINLAYKLLRPGGRLYVSVPNIESLQLRVGKNYWAYLDISHHFTFISPLGLQKMMSNSGLREIKKFTFSMEYDVFGWQQTLLNIISRSYNYYYFKKKKALISEHHLKYPLWTIIVTSLGFLLIPFSFILSLYSSVINKQSCVEMSQRKPQ